MNYILRLTRRFFFLCCFIRWKTKEELCSLTRSAWNVWTARTPTENSAADSAPPNGTDLRSSWAPCTHTTFSPPCRVATNDSRCVYFYLLNISLTRISYSLVRPDSSVVCSSRHLFENTFGVVCTVWLFLTCSWAASDSTSNVICSRNGARLIKRRPKILFSFENSNRALVRRKLADE